MEPPPSNSIDRCLTPGEKAFIHAVLWEEAHLEQGSAHDLARRHRLSLPRMFEPFSRLDPSIQDFAVTSLDEPRPAAEWPWPGREGDEAIRDLWKRCLASKKGPADNVKMWFCEDI